MPNAILTSAIDALASRRDLSSEATAEVLAEIMHGDVSETQIAGFLIALRTKGETVEELAGLARTMRELATPVSIDRDDLLDTAGTGSPPGRVARSPSTATARPPVAPARPICSRRSAPASTSPRSRSRAVSRRRASGSCSRPHTIRRPAS
jgi:hypothetical protein